MTENSSWQEICKHYPAAPAFLEKKYRLTPEKIHSEMSLAELTRKFDLPPAQILFMEIQLHQMPSCVEQITALEAKHLLETNSAVRVLDIRENWEISFGSLPRSEVLTQKLFTDLRKQETKDTPLLLYCHFGVRSLDAAHELAKEDFTHVFVIQGGIDAWSTQVDPTIPRYTGAYC